MKDSTKVKGVKTSAVATATSSGSIGFSGILTIVFIVLKLTGVISWSWVWVLSPIWISILLTIIICVILFGFVFSLNK